MSIRKGKNRRGGRRRKRRRGEGGGQEKERKREREIRKRRERKGMKRCDSCQSLKEWSTQRPFRRRDKIQDQKPHTDHLQLQNEAQNKALFAPSVIVFLGLLLRPPACSFCH